MNSQRSPFVWKKVIAIQNQFFAYSNTDDSIDGILTKLTDSLDALSPDHAVTVLLKNSEGLIPSAGSRISEEWKKIITPLPLGLNIGSCGTAGFLKERVIVSNILKDPLWENFRDFQPVHGFMACWSEPLLDTNGDLLGTFAVYFKDPRVPTSDEIELIELLSNTVSMVLQRKRSDSELRDKIEIISKLSETDSLTGINNRRAFFRKGEYLFSQNKRFNHDLSVMSVDLDRFKGINDTYGHATGDLVLKTVAEVITDTIRVADVAGRIGGDEFLVLLAETTEADAIDISERIRKHIEKTDIGSSNTRATVSIGVASTSRVQKESLVDLIEASDRALYLAKRDGGRNCVASEL